MGLFGFKNSVSLLLTWCQGSVNPWSLLGQQVFRGGKNLTQNDHIYTWLCWEALWLYHHLYKPWLLGIVTKIGIGGGMFFKLWYLQDPSVTQWAELVAEEPVYQLIPSPVVDMPASLDIDSDKPNPSMLWAGNRLDEPRPTIQKTSATTQVHLASSCALTMSQMQCLGRKHFSPAHVLQFSRWSTPFIVSHLQTALHVRGN